MRCCRIDLPNRCYHLISRVAHRAFEFGGLQTANRKDRYDKEKLLWQSTVAIKSDPVGSEFDFNEMQKQLTVSNKEDDKLVKNEILPELDKCYEDSRK